MKSEKNYPERADGKPLEKNPFLPDPPGCTGNRSEISFEPADTIELYEVKTAVRYALQQLHIEEDECLIEVRLFGSGKGWKYAISTFDSFINNISEGLDICSDNSIPAGQASILVSVLPDYAPPALPDDNAETIEGHTPALNGRINLYLWNLSSKLGSDTILLIPTKTFQDTDWQQVAL